MGVPQGLILRPIFVIYLNETFAEENIFLTIQYIIFNRENKEEITYLTLIKNLSYIFIGVVIYVILNMMLSSKNYILR